jgi:hypothetical protein
MMAATILFTTILASLALSHANQRFASPVIAIVNRWLRWVIFALGAAKICEEFELINRPLWVLVVGFFLIYFLIETAYRWLEIHALSISPIPLFPKYQVNAGGDEWPTSGRILKVRDWLRGNGFRQVQALRAEVGGGIYLRSSFYQDTEALYRVQLTFLPQASGGIAMCTTVSSLTESGQRFLTDNLFLPFGGFYPESWQVERNPWRRSMPALLARHRARLKRAGERAVPWSAEPLGDLNSQQRELERLNTELGFLFPYAEREDHGKITYEGRFRVWKELWSLNYFGRSARY